MVIVQQLRATLPPGYTAGPKVHLGAFCEIDISTYESDEASSSPGWTLDREGGGVALASWAATEPSVALEVEPEEDYEYAVHVYDEEREQTLVAAIEIVSPANKDRPEKRNNFVAKCAALLRAGVTVCIVDLVTIRQFNLYTQLMGFIGQPRADRMCANPPATYCAACRWGKRDGKTRLEAWSHAVPVGDSLPTLPLWLTENLVVPLDLERSYEQACHDLWIA